MYKSKKGKILILIMMLSIVLINTSSASAATDELSEEEIQFMNDARESMNMVMTLIWIAVAIIVSIICTLIVICYLLYSITKKYLQRVDHLLGVRQSQRYDSWEDHNAYQRR